ncbi:MAG TPA: rhomboid family intramembrane serine protease [Anaerolineales bacterium]|nr:rhomboid family intramembrane serine protease [Anaerolineales bacterium]
MNDSPSVSDSSTPTSGTSQPAPQSIRVPMPRSAPYMTYAIIGITVLVFVLQLLSIAIFGRFSGGIDLLETYGALIGSAVRAGELWRLITPILLHDNTFFLHILFNMYALYSFGIGLERHFGHGRFLLLYLLGGFSGNVMSFVVSSQHYSYSIGASTAIFGLLGAEAIFLIQNRKLFAGQFRSAIGNIIFIAAINLFIIGSLPGIDNWGHIGGLLGGLIFTSFAGPLYELEGIYPTLRLMDRRPVRDVMIGAAVVVLIFGGLAMWGMVR